MELKKPSMLRRVSGKKSVALKEFSLWGLFDKEALVGFEEASGKEANTHLLRPSQSYRDNS